MNDTDALFDRCAKAAQILKQMADDARSLGLRVSESNLRDAAVSAQMAVDFQKGITSGDPQSLARARALGFLPHEDAKTEPWANVAADTIRRRGLVK